MIFEILFTVVLVTTVGIVLYFILSKKISSLSDKVTTSLNSLNTQLINLANYTSNTYVTSEQYVPLYNNFSGLQKQVKTLELVQDEEFTTLKQITDNIQAGKAPLQSVYFS